MQLSIHQTDYQKEFLSLVKGQSIDFYRPKFLNCNVSADLDYSLTSNLFNLINKEISSLLDSIPALIDAYSASQIETKNLKKTILADHSANRFSYVSEYNNTIDHFVFSSNLRKQSASYQFLQEKFKASMHKLFVTTGLYEELYMINTLALSYDSSFTLTFDKSIFTFSTRSNSVSFRVFPIFFLIKFLLSMNDSNLAIRFVLEQFLTRNLVGFHQVQYLVTISDMEQISRFYDFCSMQYLSEFLMTKLSNNEQFQLPRVINLSQFHL